MLYQRCLFCLGTFASNLPKCRQHLQNLKSKNHGFIFIWSENYGNKVAWIGNYGNKVVWIGNYGNKVVYVVDRFITDIIKSKSIVWEVTIEKGRG